MGCAKKKAAEPVVEKDPTEKLAATRNNAASAQAKTKIPQSQRTEKTIVKKPEKLSASEIHDLMAIRHAQQKAQEKLQDTSQTTKTPLESLNPNKQNSPAEKTPNKPKKTVSKNKAEKPALTPNQVTKPRIVEERPTTLKIDKKPRPTPGKRQELSLQPELETLPPVKKQPELKLTTIWPVAAHANEKVVEALPKASAYTVSREPAEQEYQELSLSADGTETEDDSWLDNLIQARLSTEIVSLNEEVPASEVILADITETLELPEEIVEQTETLVVNLPETVQDRLAEFITDEMIEPEMIAATEELVVKIAQVADRLHELSHEQSIEITAEQIQEIAEIKVVLREWYAELLTTLGMPADEEAITAFIELICSEAYQPAQAKVEEEELAPDIFGERKRDLPFDLSAIIGGVVRVEHRLQREIARLMVRRSMAAA